MGRSRLSLRHPNVPTEAILANRLSSPLAHRLGYAKRLEKILAVSGVIHPVTRRWPDHGNFTTMFLFVLLFCLAKESRREMDVLAASNASLATNDRTSLAMTTRANPQTGGANSSTVR